MFKIIEGNFKDSQDMGRAMAPSAYHTIGHCFTFWKMENRHTLENRLMQKLE